ncbi:MAG: hypothetical protein LBB90_08895 [Tannerella sp.]|jgi:hypothetical protein|nr:hypothetical protein [Tannerella sp.]
MTRTGQQIENDLYEFLKKSSLPGIISGNVYKYGVRPKDSVLEDAIVKFVEGSDGDIQEGTVVVNIYVPDFDPYGDGILRKDIERCQEIEVAANTWVESLGAGRSDYQFRKAQTIHTQEEDEIRQHFVTVRLRYRVTTF